MRRQKVEQREAVSASSIALFAVISRREAAILLAKQRFQVIAVRD